MTNVYNFGKKHIYFVKFHKILESKIGERLKRGGDKNTLKIRGLNILESLKKVNIIESLANS